MNYLDTNVICYAIENHPTFGAACKEILEDIYTGKTKAASSVLVLVEIISALKKINKELYKLGKQLLDIQMNIDAILSLPIEWIDLEIFVIKRAADYSFNIPGADYIHIATMEIMGVNEILSADADFDKVSFIKRIDPRDYV